MKRKACLLLAVLMLLSVVAVFSSCSEGGDDTAATTVTTTAQSGDTTDPEVQLFDDIPTGNYGGYTFQFLNNLSNYAITKIVPEDTTDSLDAAMYARNAYVKERLQIDIVDHCVSYNDVNSTMRALMSSNDFEFDAVYNEGYFQTALAQAGAYLSVSDLTDNINLSKPWWFTDAMESIAIDGKNFELYSDIQLMYYDSIWGMVFNQQDLIDNKITFPYELVRSGDWTIEEMEKIMKATYQKPGQLHCAVFAPYNFASAMIVACDFSLVVQDDEEVLKIFDDETRFVDVYTRIKDVYYVNNGHDKMNFVTPDSSSSASENMSAGGKQGPTNFGAGQCTFFAGTIGDLRPVRAGEADYGVLPLPKYDTDQESYVSMVVNYAASLCVPATSPDVNRTTVILENLAAYSYKFVRYEYYDVIVQGRMVRDNDSIEMLDVIFGHTDLGVTRIEIDMMYSLGLTGVIRASISDCVANIMVNVESAIGAAEGAIESIIEAYK
ncbi:MAG: hypothetical protein J6Q77_00515 [Clostridia bacterium]|nr:hypothetical protein [Clostridia bacterium]